VTISLVAQGHPAITASHAKTFELTRDAGIGPRATCVVGVSAAGDWGALRALGRRPVTITLRVGEHREVVHAVSNPFVDDGLIVRRSGFRDAHTLATNADRSAADFSRAFVQALADPQARLLVDVEAGEPEGRFVWVTTQAPGRDMPGVEVALMAPGLDLSGAEELVAEPTRAAMAAACVALVAPGAMAALHVDALPKGATARRVLFASPYPVVLPLTDTALPDDRPVAMAIETGEVAVPVHRGVVRVPKGAAGVMAVAPAPSDELRTLFTALLAEGVSPRALAKAAAHLPGWDYNAFIALAQEQ
jgi:hypothetical protein